MSMYADMPREMPAWFSGVSDYLTKVMPGQDAIIKQNQANVLDVMKIVHMDNARIKDLENVLLKLEEWKRVCLNVLRAEIAKESVPRHEQLDDNCEVRVSNIPIICQSEPFDIATSVLSAIGCGHLCNQLVDAREWNIPDNQSSTRSIVFQFCSSISRNKAMRNAPRLSKLTAGKVLGINSQTRLYLNQLLPKPLYVLYRLACDRARELGFMRPFVRDLKILMRASRDSPLFEINSESDLSKIQSTLHSNQLDIVETLPSTATADTTTQSFSTSSETKIQHSSTTVNSVVCEQTLLSEPDTSNTNVKCKRKISKKKSKPRAVER